MNVEWQSLILSLTNSAALGVFIGSIIWFALCSKKSITVKFVSGLVGVAIGCTVTVYLGKAATAYPVGLLVGMFVGHRLYKDKSAPRPSVSSKSDNADSSASQGKAPPEKTLKNSNRMILILNLSTAAIIVVVSAFSVYVNNGRIVGDHKSVTQINTITYYKTNIYSVYITNFVSATASANLLSNQTPLLPAASVYVVTNYVVSAIVTTNNDYTSILRSGSFGLEVAQALKMHQEKNWLTGRLYYYSAEKISTFLIAKAPRLEVERTLGKLHDAGIVDVQDSDGGTYYQLMPEWRSRPFN